MASEITVNTLSKASGNNITMDDSLNIKNLTETQRDALSGVVAGLTIFNSTSGKVETYNGSEWRNL